jgi:hypothetical protein
LVGNPTRNLGVQILLVGILRQNNSSHEENRTGVLAKPQSERCPLPRVLDGMKIEHKEVRPTAEYFFVATSEAAEELKDRLEKAIPRVSYTVHGEDNQPVIRGGKPVLSVLEAEVLIWRFLRQKSALMRYPFRGESFRLDSNEPGKRRRRAPDFFLRSFP